MEKINEPIPSTPVPPKPPIKEKMDKEKVNIVQEKETQKVVTTTTVKK